MLNIKGESRGIAIGWRRCVDSILQTFVVGHFCNGPLG